MKFRNTNSLIYVFSCLCASMSFSNAHAQEFPFSDGKYAATRSLCNYDDISHQVVRIEGEYYFQGDAACQMENLKIFNDNVIFDSKCSAEGEETNLRKIWIVTGPDMFADGSIEYQLCGAQRRDTSADNTIPDGMLAVTHGDAIYSLQVSLQKLGYNPGPLDGQLGSKTMKALNKFQRDSGLPVTIYVTKEAAKEAYKREMKQVYGEIIDEGTPDLSTPN